MLRTHQLIKRWEQSMERRLPAHLPICIRLDGVSFKSYTAPLRRPFDLRFTAAMEQTASDLLQYFNACCAYTQSDEITLILPPAALPQPPTNDIADPHSSVMYAGLLNINTAAEHPYNGRSAKLISIASSLAAAAFNKNITAQLSNANETMRLALFDARCFSLPTAEDALAVLMWRQQYDGYRNTVNRLGQHFFGHKQCQGLGRQQIRDRLLKEHFVDTLPPHDNPLSSDCVPSLARSDCEVFITNEHQKQYLNQRLAYGRLLKKECFLVDSMDPRTKQQVQAERTRISGKSFPLDCLPTADMANLIFSRRWA